MAPKSPAAMPSSQQGVKCVSPKEFAVFSGLSLSTVRRYLADGRLPKIQPGGHRGRVLIPCDVLERVRADDAVPHDEIDFWCANGLVEALSIQGLRFNVPIDDIDFQ